MEHPQHALLGAVHMVPLIAAATRFGYTKIAEASKFTERQLREAAERHFTIEHLADADALVFDAIRGLAQTSTIDVERISSSDGQRYPDHRSQRPRRVRRA